MSDSSERPKIDAAIVHAIEEGGGVTADGYGIVRLSLTQGPAALAFSIPQLRQFLLQIAGLLGKADRDRSVVWHAENWRVTRTFDDSLRLDFTLEGGATMSCAIPMADAPQVANQIEAEVARAQRTPPEGQRH